MGDIIEFDYSGLSKEVQNDLIGCAESIRKKCGKHVESALAIGKELIHALAKLPEGSRVSWLERECGVSKSAAYNYMAIYKAFGEFPHCGNYEVSAMVTLAANSTATKTSKKMASQGILITNKVAKKLLDAKPKAPRIEAAPVIEDAEFEVVRHDSGPSESTEADSPKDEPTAPPNPVPPKPPVAEKDYGTCPNCAGTKWTTDDDGTACSRCHHPHGEPVGDKDDDDAERAKIQRAKTVKTVEALMRAFDDLQLLIPLSRVHDEALAGCKVLLKLAKGWQ